MANSFSQIASRAAARNDNVMQEHAHPLFDQLESAVSESASAVEESANEQSMSASSAPAETEKRKRKTITGKPRAKSASAKRRKQRIGLTLPPEVIAEMKRAAERDGTSVSALVVEGWRAVSGRHGV